jgi:hypothetical protein
VLAALFAFSLAACAAGCGGSGSSGGGATASNGIELKAGAPPSASTCGFDRLGSSARSARGSQAAPAPGTYSYTSRGTDSVPGTGGRPRALPKSAETLITPARRSGGLTCFGSEQRYSPSTHTSNVYIVRGGDIYIVGVGFNTSSYVQKVLPQPAILAVSATSTSWTGAFRGPTSGSYRVEILRRGSMKVGGKSVSAVELSSKATFTGELTGTQDRTTWLARDRSLVLEESGHSNLRFGGDEEKLAYTIKLRSLQPK